MGLHWPPTGWDEDDLMRDECTRLPTALYPFQMEREHDDHGRLTGRWEIKFYPRDGSDKDRLIAVRDETFAAFQVMFKAYREWFPTRPEPQVYFIGTQLKPGALVKIGFSQSPIARLRQLQTSNPERLQIFVSIPGTKHLEQKYHSRWKPRRRTGEWFVLGDCIIDEINRLIAANSAGGTR
jgi:hypothetical protein